MSFTSPIHKSWIAICLFLFFPGTSSKCAIVHVTNNLDSGPGSLRSQIAAAQSGDTICFATSLMGDSIVFSAGPITINKNLTLIGLGDSSLFLSGNGVNLILSVTGGTQIWLEKVALRNGVGSDGGAVSNASNLTIVDCSFTGNYASTEGGAISNTGNLTLVNCQFVGNNSSRGGAIYNRDSLGIVDCIFLDNFCGSLGGAIFGAVSKPVKITRTRFEGNESGHLGGSLYCDCRLQIDSCLFVDNIGNGGGGAIRIHTLNPSYIAYSTFVGNQAPNKAGGAIKCAEGGALEINQCTFSANSAYGGGAIDYDLDPASPGNAWIRNSTFTLNDAVGAGDAILHTNYDTLYLQNCLVAGNLGNDITGSPISLGNNLIGKNGGLGMTLQASDQVGTGALPIDPQLDSLGYYGGFTPTHRLQPCSPAIDAGNALPETIDQRGMFRSFNGIDDIGAYELQQAACLLDFGESKQESLPVIPYWLFPNPASHRISLLIEQVPDEVGLISPDGTYFLLELMGIEAGRANYQVQGIPSGMYVLQVRLGEFWRTAKLAVW